MKKYKIISGLFLIAVLIHSCCKNKDKYYYVSEKPGYEILNTHRLLKRPVHDRFPLDFLAEVLWPWTIEDSYTWSFKLKPFEPVSSPELIEAAYQMRQQADSELGKVAVEVLAEETK